MKLIYAWVENFRGIKNRQFSFDSNFQVNYTGEKIEIKNKISKLPKDFFGENIYNITAIVGKNGSGKSSLLELLSWKRYDVKNNTDYFLIYSIGENEYIVEGCGSDKIEKILDQTPFGFQNKYFIKVKYEENFIFINYPNFDNQSSRCSIFHMKENNRIEKYYEELDAGDIYFNRAKSSYKNVSYIEKYKYLKKILNTQEEKIYLKKSLSIKIECLEENLEGPLKNIFEHNYFDNISSRNDIPIIKNADEKLIIWIILYINYTFKDVEFYLNRYKKKSKIAKEFYELKSKMLNVKMKKDITVNELLANYLKPVTLIREKYIYENLSVKGSGWYDNFVKIIENVEINKNKNQIETLGIEIDINSPEINIKKLLQIFDDERIEESMGYNTSDLSRFFYIGFGNFSDGEEKIIDIFSQINTIFKNSTLENGRETIILLLDEPEMHLHPEWCRLLIKLIVDEIKNFKDYKFQIILTSHSPFIMSDLPKENLIFMRENSNLEECFATNIHELLKKGFFMEATIGEFAKQKIEWVLEKMKKDSKDIEKNEKEKILKIISLVGENFLKKKLYSLYNNKFEITEEEKIKRALLNMTSNQQKIIKKMIKNGEV